MQEKGFLYIPQAWFTKGKSRQKGSMFLNRKFARQKFGAGTNELKGGFRAQNIIKRGG